MKHHHQFKLVNNNTLSYQGWPRLFNGGFKNEVEVSMCHLQCVKNSPKCEA